MFPTGRVLTSALRAVLVAAFCAAGWLLLSAATSEAADQPATSDSAGLGTRGLATHLQGVVGGAGDAVHELPGIVSSAAGALTGGSADPIALSGAVGALSGAGDDAVASLPVVRHVVPAGTVSQVVAPVAGVVDVLPVLPLPDLPGVSLPGAELADIPASVVDGLLPQAPDIPDEGMPVGVEPVAPTDTAAGPDAAHSAGHSPAADHPGGHLVRFLERQTLGTGAGPLAAVGTAHHPAAAPSSERTPVPAPDPIRHPLVVTGQAAGPGSSAGGSGGPGPLAGDLPSARIIPPGLLTLSHAPEGGWLLPAGPSFDPGSTPD